MAILTVKSNAKKLNIEKSNIKKYKRWSLDSAGILYPAISTSKWGSTFRVSVYLKSQVNADLLQRALDRVLPRFPTMAVQMRNGFFWHYLEENTKPLLIQPDKTYCAAFSWSEENAYMLRVLYTERCVSVEFFHAITDGGGSIVFLKTLIAEYLRLNGVQIPTEPEILDLREEPSFSELEDAYKRIPLPDSRKWPTFKEAYCFPGKMKKPQVRHVMKFYIPVDALKKEAKSIGVTVTEYLTAAILFIGYMRQKESNPSKMLPIRVSVPVNMRGFFKTNSLRNFTAHVTPTLEPTSDEYTFEEIAEKVHKDMKQELTPENLYAAIAPNIIDGKRLWVQYVPLAIKNLGIKIGYNIMQHRVITTILTNLGKISAPAEMMEHVDRFDAMLGADLKPGSHCTVVTSGETLQLIFSSNQENPILQYEFKRFLNINGIPFEVSDNSNIEQKSEELDVNILTNDFADDVSYSIQ